MTIEFHCPHCDKPLKTPDSKAGVRANCPGCGQLVTVPDIVEEAAEADGSFAVPHTAAGAVPPDANWESATDPSLENETKECPMCGGEIRKAATKCRHCGEMLARRPGPGTWTPTRIDAGEILNRAWEIYKRELGMLIASILIAFGIPFGVYIVLSFVQQIVLAATFAAVGPQGGGGGGVGAGALALVLGMSFLSMVINFGVQQFMQAGLVVFMLRIARGGKPEIADLFSGKPYFWRFFWGGLLFSIMIVLGSALLIVPGILLALAFWAMTYIIVDRNVGVIDSLRLSYDAMAANYMAVFLLGLTAIGIHLLGMLACCVGALFALPLSTLLMAVAYCGISGQLAESESSSRPNVG